MGTYVRMFESHAKQESDDPTIGLILCSKNNEALAKYSAVNENRQLFAAKYVVATIYVEPLPTVSE